MFRGRLDDNGNPDRDDFCRRRGSMARYDVQSTTATRRRCFCEKVRLEGNIEQDVEHFRPKAKVQPWTVPPRSSSRPRHRNLRARDCRGGQPSRAIARVYAVSPERKRRGSLRPRRRGAGRNRRSCCDQRDRHAIVTTIELELFRGAEERRCSRLSQARPQRIQAAIVHANRCNTTSRGLASVVGVAARAAEGGRSAPDRVNAIVCGQEDAGLHPVVHNLVLIYATEALR